MLLFSQIHTGNISEKIWSGDSVESRCWKDSEKEEVGFQSTAIQGRRDGWGLGRGSQLLLEVGSRMYLYMYMYTVHIYDIMHI